MLACGLVHHQNNNQFSLQDYYKLRDYSLLVGNNREIFGKIMTSHAEYHVP